MASFRTKREAEQAADVASQECKRVKSVVNNIVDEYVCPITQELPLDPVTAEDGKIYERSSIEEWLSKHARSPFTNQAMGKKLLPATQVRNIIEQLLQAGIIQGEKATRWTAKLEDEKTLKSLREKADAGNVMAMRDLGDAHKDGKLGLCKSDSEALRYFVMGADLGDSFCMRRAGVAFLEGRGTLPQSAHGLVLLSRAAEHKDATIARYELAKAYFHGSYGLAKNSTHAKYWLNKVREDGFRNLNERGKSRALHMMQQLGMS